MLGVSSRHAQGERRPSPDLIGAMDDPDRAHGDASCRRRRMWRDLGGPELRTDRSLATTLVAGPDRRRESNALAYDRGDIGPYGDAGRRVRIGDVPVHVRASGQG